MKPVLYKLMGTWNGWRGGIWSGEGSILYQSWRMQEVSSVVPKTISSVVNSSSHCQTEWWVCHFPDLYWPGCCWIESLFPSLKAYAQDLYTQLVASGRWQWIYLHCDQWVGLCPSLQFFIFTDDRLCCRASITRNPEQLEQVSWSGLHVTIFWLKMHWNLVRWTIVTIFLLTIRDSVHCKIWDSSCRICGWQILW